MLGIVPVFPGKKQSYYRTHSHAGFPKGAYSNPHPVHYHIPPCTQIQLKEKPTNNKRFLNQKRDYIYSARSYNVTITLNNRDKTAFSLPINVVHDFIYPFASMLNIIQTPALGNVASQTSYLKQKSNERSEEDLSDFEYDILKKLRSNLVNDITEKVDLPSQDDINNIAPLQKPQPEINFSFLTTDEGFNDTVNKTESLAQFEPNELVIKMSEQILQYLKEECFEIQELVLFPEIIYDQNVQKLLDRLKLLLDKHYPDNLPPEEMNELRIQVMSEVLTQLQLEDVNSPSVDVSFLSDKLFSTTEFISDLLDKFFCQFSDFDDFNNFKEALTCASGEISSTPDAKSNCSDEHEVMSFKKSVAKKSGNETFWITISKSTLPKSPSISRKIINVDDIPLKPPVDLVKTSLLSQSKLSPILEEARRKLDFGDESISDSDCDILAGGDTENSNTYIMFDNPEVNILCETTQFHRTNTINTTSYVNKSTVHFARSENSDSFEGDWMGYEKAKF